jgi:hypothetical protein
MVATTFPLVAPFGTTAVTLVLVQFVVEAGRLLKVTVPVVPVKLLPAIEMVAPGSPLEGVRPVIVGATATVKFAPLLATPPAAVTTTLPDTAADGTLAVMVLLIQPVIVAAAPPNVTALPAPWALKFDPAMVTEEVTAPVFGVRLVMLGAAVTVNVGPAGLETPPAVVTTTDPVVAPAGTTAVMLLVVQLLIDVAAILPNFTALPVPWALKFDPAMVTEDAIAPELGVRLVMLGAGVTVNGIPALCTPPAAVITTLPETAPDGTTAVMLLVVQLLIDAAATLPNFTALPVPWALKFDPVMVTEDAIAPELGVRLVMLGAGVTEKFTAALVCPPTVTVAGTLPVGTPEGMGAVMLVEVHVEGTVVVPLNFTVLPLSCEERKFVPVIRTEEVMAPAPGVKELIVGTPVARGRVICESKFPFSVPSRSSSPLKLEFIGEPVRFTPTHK